MIIALKESHKSNLNFLFTQNASVVQDFCKLALDYLTKGPNQKIYLSAAQKLEIDADTVQNAVEGLINLLIECSKHQLSALDLRDTILTIGFTEEHYDILQAFYDSRQTELKQILAEQTVDFPQFKDLEWRLEAQVASRALLDQMTPQVQMKLSLENSAGTEHVLLQADPANLVHMTEVLETALREASSQHFRRIQRRFK
ncbi:COMM domain-containing protein 2 [Homalodisca vitripennis]|uniref:COMM domain-containing protein n=1 Tax=Homalodisca liturata TaxID=320908 RepID=A0A1B6H7Z1_9HEMI|nr:COMM domain-containing protein 2 [Homalodisca vitripennis]